jgi:cell division septal protein FtsQ
MAVFYTVRAPFFLLSDVVVAGAETVSIDDIKQHAEDKLRGSYFGFIPHRFSFFIPTKSIEESILAMPRIASAVLSVENNALVITVKERSPDVLWCGDDTATSTCFYVAKDGVAYEAAPSLSGTTLMRFVVSSTSPTIGATLLSEHDRSLLIGIARIMETRHHFEVARILYTPDRDAILYLARGGRLMLSTDGNLEDTYSNLASVLTSEKYSSLTPGHFEYLDLRYGNKVFLEKQVPVASTTASTTSRVQ